MVRRSTRQRSHPPRGRVAAPILDAQARTLVSSPTAVHQRVVPLVSPGGGDGLLHRLGERLGEPPVLAALGLLAALLFGRRLRART